MFIVSLRYHHTFFAVFIQEFSSAGKKISALYANKKWYNEDTKHERTHAVNTTEMLQKYAPYLRCPICHTALGAAGTMSLVCGSGHCFDAAKKGYVNFAGGVGQGALYGRELFLHRRRVLEGGFYDGLLKEIREAVQAHAGGGELRMIDAGCGEGYYLRRLAADEALQNSRTFGCDLSREGIAMAAGACRDACFLVADIANLPIQDKSMDVVLDILSPANYAEFKRVLQSDGIVIKIVPGRDYLRELREALGESIKGAKEPGALAAAHMAAQLNIVTRKKITYACATNAAQMEDFAQMTPMTQHADTEKAAWRGITSVTIDLTILVGQKR
jgi:23S rRNA (guanine745-N1)-methyltransferase